MPSANRDPGSGAEHRYRALVDSVDAIVWEADARTFRFTFVSERIEKVLGIDSGSWIARPDGWTRTLHPDDASWVTERRLSSMAAGEDHEMEYRLVSADGRIIWVHDRAFVERNDPEPTAVRGLIVDITDRKQAEIRRRAQLAVTRVLVESHTPAEIPARILHALLETLGWTAGAIWQTEHDRGTLRCIEFAPAAGIHIPDLEAATWRSEFPSGVGLPGRVHASGEPSWIEDLEADDNFPRGHAAALSGVRSAFAFPILAEGAVQGVLEFFSRDSRSPDENLLQLVATVGAQMGQFIKRRELEEELRASEARTRAVIDSALDAIITMDANGIITGFNPSAERLFGLTEAEAKGRELADTVIPPALRDAHRRGLSRFLATGESQVAGRRLEMNAIGADGSEFPVELSITIRFEEGQPVFIGFLRDLTEQQMADQRRTALHAITRVLADATSLAEATPLIVESVCHSLGWSVGLLWTLDEDAHVMRYLAGWHAGLEAAEAFIRHSAAVSFEPGHGVIGSIWQSRQALWVRDVEREPDFVRAHEAARGGLHSVFGIPIIGSGQVLGILEFYSQDIREPDDDLLRLMSGVGIQLGSFIERRRAEEASAFQRALLAAHGDASIDGILILSPDGRTLFRNKRFTELWDVPDDVVARGDEAVLRTVLDRVEDAEATLRQIEHLHDHPDLVDRAEVTLRDGRTFDRYSAPVVGEDDTLYGRVWTFRDITERKRAEEALKTHSARASFLAEVSTVLVASLDPTEMLTEITERSVPAIADWCAVDILEDDGTLNRVAIVHRDPEKAALVEDLRRRTIGVRHDPSAPRGVSRVIAGGASELEPMIEDEWLVEAVQGHEEFLRVLRGLGFRSYVCVPLRARGRIIGALTLVTAESGRTYGREDLWLAEDLARRAALAIDNAKLYAETQHVASTLQASLIPPSLPEIPGVEVAARFRPAGRGAEVGGDFYDLFNPGRNDWAIVMGDVCGKGADAAAVTALARYTIRAAAMQTRRPSLILQQLNEALLEQRDDDRFCTVAYVRLRRLRGALRLTTSCGGHPLPVVIRASGEVERVGDPGLILGAFDHVTLSEHSTTMSAGDTIVLYTDGVSEAGGPGAMLGDEGILELLGGRAWRDADQVAEALERAALARSDDGVRDDAAIVVLRVEG